MYTVDYFIKKFEAIPENRWWTKDFVSIDGWAKCALGHCGVTQENLIVSQGMEGHAIISLFDKYLNGTSVWAVNDNDFDYGSAYNQPTPKQRILAALYDIKKMQQPQHEDITASLAILPVNETSDLVQSAKEQLTPLDI